MIRCEETVSGKQSGFFRNDFNAFCCRLKTTDRGNKKINTEVSTKAHR